MRALRDPLRLTEVRLQVLEARLDARRRISPGQLSLDLTAGAGVQCGNGWISPDKTCRKGKGAQKPLHPLFQEAQRRRAAEEKAAAARPTEATRGGGSSITLEDGEPQFMGRAAVRKLGSGAFGTTYQFDTDDGPVVVKVNGLKMGDPGESDPGVTLDQQRENVARREFANLQRAHAAGLAPEPLGDVVQLPDGRWSLAYRMQPGAKLTPSHQSIDLTSDAMQTLQQPGARERYVAGAIQLARRQAEAGFSHGDLHGGNILVGPDGTPSLIDWAMTRESRESFNPGEPSPAARASDETYALIPLLSFAVLAPEMQGTVVAASTMASTYREKAHEAQAAYRQVIQAWDMEWEEAKQQELIERMPNDEWRRRMVEANRLKKEGMPYELALRDPRVGLEAPLTPEVLARAAAARDAIFGQSELEQMRREFDQRFGAPA
jgi:hypothetical protein